MIFANYDIVDDSYYLFTCAELKAREIEFLEESKIEKMLKSQGMGEFIAALRDTVYSKYINNMGKYSGFEYIVVSEYKDMVNFLNERLRPGHKAVWNLLFLEQNLHNLKVIIKSIIMDVSLENLFIPILYSYRVLKDAAADKNYKEILPEDADVLRFGMEIKDTQKNYRFFELELEKFYLQRIFKTIKALGSRMLLAYFRHAIDILNIRNICRTKYLAEDLGFDYFLHKNGFIPKKTMMGFEGESLNFFTQEMERTDYADIVIKGTQALNSEGTLSYFNKSEDLFYINFFDSVKYSVSNIEKIFRFFLMKKIELNNLSVIFTGVSYGIESEKIKSKVRI